MIPGVHAGTDKDRIDPPLVPIRTSLKSTRSRVLAVPLLAIACMSYSTPSRSLRTSDNKPKQPRLKANDGVEISYSGTVLELGAQVTLSSRGKRHG